MAVSREELWNTGHDESVEVNQRALIDKVLARYSGEFTVFRELLQNSDDATSSAAEIHFDTRKYLELKEAFISDNNPDGASKGSAPDLKTSQVGRWTFKNNGIVFRDEDWSRLKKIAEGNPDEEKIGAFGVGFYSLFSVTEEPFVTSGDQWMGFYWKDKKDQLFARRGQLPETTPWTTFQMDLREPAPMPAAFDFIRFLSSSITFMVHLRQITVLMDGVKLAVLTKDPGSPIKLTIPKGLKTTSPSRTMIISSITSTPLYIEAHVAHCVYDAGSSKPQLLSQAMKALKPAAAAVSTGFFSSLFNSFSNSPLSTPPQTSTVKPLPDEKVKDPMELLKSSVVLHVFTAEAEVRLEKKVVADLQRSTKKNPPAKIKYDLIYTGKSEYDASKEDDDKLEQSTGSVFQGLRADLEGSGNARVFIGHATGQTTGLGGHMAARFIPTVERESIDLQDRSVSVWNKELLYVGGFLSRAAYETEMQNVQELWSASAEAGPVDGQLASWLTDRALHALKFFTFRTSTPSGVVSQLLEAAFFSCATAQDFLIMSSVGVKRASDVRIPDPTFSFLTKLPMLPEAIQEGAQQMIDALRARGLIKEIMFSDVLSELRARPLSEAELIACIRWWIRLWASGASVQANLPQVRSQLLEAAILSTGESNENERILPLVQIRTFVNISAMGSILPLDGPFPDHTIPLEVSKAFSAADLGNAFGWQQLDIVEWTRHVASLSGSSSKDPEYDFAVSAVWAERVLNALARAWPSTSKIHQTEIVTLLKDKTFIPTRAGLKKPVEAYFPNAHVFPDLPVVMMPKGTPVRGGVEKVLEAVGVRRHVELQIVFNRMIKTGDWTISDLIKYLVAVQATLTSVEMERLRQTSAFPKEVSIWPDGNEDQAKRFKAIDLYEPLDIFRELRLPVIDWGTQLKWRSSSEEAKFLFSLGLRRQPPLSEILRLATSEDELLAAAALKYFIENSAKYPEYDPHNFKAVKFVPATNAEGKSVKGAPTEVFVSPDVTILNFLVVHPSLRDVASEKLKLGQYPPTNLIIPLLEKSAPKNVEGARLWFEALTARITDFHPSQLKKIGEMPIVPAQRPSAANGNSDIDMLQPRECYFRRDNSENIQSKLFVFVDFGPKANAFLSACGTRSEPSVEEIVQILLSDPREFYQLSGGRESYLSELRNIAVNRRLLSSGAVARMKRTSFLLGSRRVKKERTDLKRPIDDALDEEEWDAEHDLLRPDQIVIADDTSTFQVFGDSVFCAPQEDLLEEFYLALGSSRLTSLVKEEYGTTAEVKDSKLSRDIRELILERLPLFLHEHTHAAPKVQYSWLNNEKNFLVKTFGKLTVSKVLRHGGKRLARNQDASAAAKKASFGPVELWIGGNAQVDMYEVAISLCRVLFDVPKANDALLFMTILSTDLRALRRRGYNVDRILKKQRAEREAADLKRKEEAKEKERLISDLQPQMPQHPVPGIASSIASLPVAKDSISPRVLEKLSPTSDAASNAVSQAPPSADVEDSDKVSHRHSRAGSSLTNTFQKWGRKLGVPGHQTASEPSLPVGTRSETGQGTHRTRTPQPHVTPRSNIESNINQAIAACREEQGNVLQNRESMQTVKESLDEGYCDVSGRVSDLINIGSMSDIRIYAAKDVLDSASLIPRKHDTIARFIHIIQPLRALYRLAPTSVNIFYDLEGETIAFNRNASIFVNLRYYEAWHDNSVADGDLSQALISWFFTLAHEIAHNLVQPHNSEHEFYFSSICEAHVVQLGRLIPSAK